MHYISTYFQVQIYNGNFFKSTCVVIFRSSELGSTDWLFRHSTNQAFLPPPARANLGRMPFRTGTLAISLSAHSWFRRAGEIAGISLLSGVGWLNFLGTKTANSGQAEPSAQYFFKKFDHSWELQMVEVQYSMSTEEGSPRRIFRFIVLFYS